MDPQIVQDTRGKCPVCGMTLEPVRLDTVWSCPVHAAVTRPQPGRCPVCRRDLVQVTVALTWACADRPGPARTSPWRCADGSNAAIAYAPRPHGNHNPQHGGAFFMAPDNWHHLEGTYAGDGVFRVYLYDDYSKPLPVEQVRRVSGRVELANVTVPLTIDGGRYLEARIPGATLPLEITAKLKFQPDGPEHRFDFAFQAYSTEVARSANPDVRVGPATADLDALHERARALKAAIDRRAYAEIWVPALQAKDLALAIEAGSAALPEARRAALASAARRLVQAAWMLDGYGDMGNGEQIADAYARFAAALADLDEALSGARK